MLCCEIISYEISASESMLELPEGLETIEVQENSLIVKVDPFLKDTPDLYKFYIRVHLSSEEVYVAEAG